MLSKVNLYNLVRKIGFFVLCAYIFFSYTANGSFLPSILNSLSLYLMVALGFFALLLSGKFKIGFSFFYLFFLVFSIVSVIYSDGPDWGGTLYRMVVVFLICVAIEHLVISKEDINTVLLSFSIGCTALTVFLHFSDRLYEDERLGTTLFGNANTFAMLYMFAMMSTIWLLLHHNFIGVRIYAAFALIANIYPMLLSGGRKFVIIPILFAYILLMLKRDKHGRTHIFRYTIVIALFVGIFLFLILNIPILYDAIGYRMQYLINSFIGEGEIGNSNELRFSMMELAFWEGLESPIWGHGFDSFKYLGEQSLGYYAYSHNNWTELFYNVGILGMVMYYLYHFSLLIRSFKKSNRHNPYISFSIAFIISIIIFEFGCVTYSEVLIQMFLSFTGLAYTISNKELKNE